MLHFVFAASPHSQESGTTRTVQQHLDPFRSRRMQQRQNPFLHLLGRKRLADIAARPGQDGLLHMLLA